MASPGFLLMAILALATCGEEPAPLHIFLKNPPPSPHFLKLRRAQRLAAIVKTRLFFERLVEQRDGVIQIFPLRGFDGLGEQRPHVARNVIDVFICHVVLLVE